MSSAMRGQHGASRAPGMFDDLIPAQPAQAKPGMFDDLSPEEMNGLRQAHKMLEYFKEAEKRATVGSNTADKAAIIPEWAQLVVRHVKGDLAGGGLIKRFKLMMELLPTNKRNADEIVQMLGSTRT